jgi:hypothetical protein
MMKHKYVKKEPTPPPKLVADKKPAVKKAKKRASPKRSKSLKCPRMEKAVTLSLLLNHKQRSEVSRRLAKVRGLL